MANKFERTTPFFFVNVSVGGKIQAIASMMACMMFKDMTNITPCYTPPNKYTSSVANEERPQK
jgi:hypothetical protein